MEDYQMKKLDLIIIDMDGTLYCLDDIMVQVYKAQVSFLSGQKGWPYEYTEKFLHEKHVYPFINKESNSATKLFSDMGLDLELWKNYRNTYVDYSKISKKTSATRDIIVQFSKIAPIVLLSTNNYATIEFVLSHLQIEKSLFSGIYSHDFNPIKGTFSKKEVMIYEKIHRKIEYKNMISIGDRYNTDIKPMLELGGYGILVNNPLNLSIVCNCLKSENVLESNEYEFYTPLSVKDS